MAGLVNYSVHWQNQSDQSGDIFMFQKDPDIGPDALSLAWFSKSVHPTTKGYFQWQIAYNFVWAETGELQPGVIFAAGQTRDADLQTTNQITLTHTGDAYDFIDQGPGPKPGSLYVKEDGTIPARLASVGIGMSNAGTFVVQAEPNMKLEFTPRPTYWIAFGKSISLGEVLISEVSDAMQITFPTGVTAMATTFQANNEWSTPVPYSQSHRLWRPVQELATANRR